MICLGAPLFNSTPYSGCRSSNDQFSIVGDGIGVALGRPASSTVGFGIGVAGPTVGDGFGSDGFAGVAVGAEVGVGSDGSTGVGVIFGSIVGDGVVLALRSHYIR